MEDTFLSFLLCQSVSSIFQYNKYLLLPEVKHISLLSLLT